MAEIPRNTRASILHDGDSNIITTIQDPVNNNNVLLNVTTTSNENASNLKYFDGGSTTAALGGNLATTAIDAQGEAYAAQFESATYIQEIKMRLQFIGLGADLEFEGWGDNSNALNAEVKLAFSDSDAWNNPPPAEDIYYDLVFTQLYQVLEYGDVDYTRDGDNAIFIITRKFNPPILLAPDPDDDSIKPLIRLDLPASVDPNGGNGELDSGNCTEFTIKIKYRSAEAYTELNEAPAPASGPP